MKQTNINITYQDKSFNYLIEYIQDPDYSDIGDLMYTSIPQLDRLDIVSVNDYVYYGNDWYNKDNWASFIGSTYTQDYLPLTYDKSVIRFNFPEFSPEVYDADVYYMLNINTWINGKYVYLGSKLFSRYDALANETTKFFDSHKYFESIEIPIIDPFDIQYNDRWKDFRVNVCGERIIGKDGSTMNNTGAQLCFTLYIVESDGNGGWIKKSNYIGGQNSTNISTNLAEYLTLNQSILFDEDKGLVIHEELTFNESYGDDLRLYLKETYGIEAAKIKYAIVIKDKERVYKGIDENGKENIYKRQFKKFAQFTKYDINFDGWNDWLYWENEWNTNVSIASSVTFYDDNKNQLLYVIGNEIPLTKEIYKYLIKDEETEKYIDLKEIDMEIKNYNVVNKVINQIVQFDKPDDSKSNIIQPVFFRVRDIQDLIIHPAVTENICINLDAYKSKVDLFILQIENCVFKQIGANGYGIIFKVIGKNLPNEATSGVYYILNQDGELVTTGKYKYEQ